MLTTYMTSHIESCNV